MEDKTKEVEEVVGKYEIYFNAYHDGMQGIDPAPEKIWDGYEDGGMMREAGIPPTQIAKVFKARVDWASQQQVIPASYRYQLLGAEPQYDNDGEADLYILRITDRPNFEQQFRFWLEEVVNQADSVGGDDSYFDYYPDYFSVADQLASALGLEAEVAKAKKEVYDKGLYHDEDAIDHGFPLEA